VDEEGEGYDATNEASLAHQRLAQIHYFSNEIGIGTNRALCSLNLAEMTRDSPGLARSYANMCLVAGLIRLHPLAEHYAKLAEATARHTRHLPALAYALNVCSMYFLGAGSWGKVSESARECIQASERLGDMRLLGESITVQAMLSCFMCEFAASREAFERLLTVGRQSNNLLHQAWAWCGLGECVYRQGELEEAIEHIRQAVALLAGKNNRTEEIRALGLLAIAHWQSAQTRQALENAHQALQRIAQSTRATVSSLEGIAGAAEVLLLHSFSPTASDEDRRAALKIERELNRFAKVYPIGRPRALRLAGLRCWFLNRPRKAVQRWKRSLQIARDLALPLDIGLALYEVGRHLRPDSPQRRDRLVEAAAVFDKIGSMQCLSLVVEALQNQ
jgi:tetratricopeptide (TPR) repeat protein